MHVPNLPNLDARLLKFAAVTAVDAVAFGFVISWLGQPSEQTIKSWKNFSEIFRTDQLGSFAVHQQNGQLKVSYRWKHGMLSP